VVSGEGEGLSGAHGDAGFLDAGNAELLFEEDDVISESGHCLDFAAHEQRVLLGNEQATVEGNIRPAAGVEHGVVEGTAIFEGDGGGLCQLELRGGVGGNGFDLFGGGRNVGVNREAATGRPARPCLPSHG